MKTCLKLNVQRSPGAIIRILGLAERRGYEPIQVLLETHQETIEIRITVQSQRPIEILIAQYNKLFGVTTVEVYHESKIRVA
jgi:acetolactate synthase regulatory subunit